MFYGYKVPKASTVDLIINYLTKTSVVTGTSEDITFRTKVNFSSLQSIDTPVLAIHLQVSLHPDDTLAKTLEFLKSRCAFYGEKEHAWTLIAYQGDKAVLLEANNPVSSFKLSPAVREVFFSLIICQ